AVMGCITYGRRHGRSVCGARRPIHLASFCCNCASSSAIESSTLATLIRRDHQLEVSASFDCDCPLLALERRAWRAKCILLPLWLLVRLAPITGDGHVEHLGWGSPRVFRFPN